MCSPAPRPFLGAGLPTQPSRGLLQIWGSLLSFTLSSPHSCFFLLSAPPFPSVLECPPPPSGCGHWWEETVWTDCVWPSPSLCSQPGRARSIMWLSGMNRRQAWMPLDVCHPCAMVASSSKVARMSVGPGQFSTGAVTLQGQESPEEGKASAGDRNAQGAVARPPTSPALSAALSCFSQQPLGFVCFASFLLHLCHASFHFCLKSRP